MYGVGIARDVIYEVVSLRQLAGITQSDMAQKAGLSSQARLSRIERRECSPSLDELMGIGAALGVPASLLLRRAEDFAVNRPKTTAVSTMLMMRFAQRVKEVSDLVALPSNSADGNASINAARAMVALGQMQVALLEGHELAVQVVASYEDAVLRDGGF